MSMFVDLKVKTKGLFGYSKKKHKEKDNDGGNVVDSQLSDYVNSSDYPIIAAYAWDALWDLYKTEEGWKLEGGKDVNKGIVHSIYVKQYGRKIFKVQGIINIDPELLHKELVEGFDEQTKWNRTIVESRTLQTVNNNTNVVYNITKEAAGGMVSARDFVNIRHWGVREGIHVAAGCGCTHPDMPVKTKIVRGENGPGGFIIEPLQDDLNKSLFYWFVNSDLKGWLPQALIDQAMSSVLLQYFENLCNHIDTSHRRGNS